MSMIPTTTGAARAVGEVLPELKGKLDGSAIRVPVPDVSLVDLTFTPKRDTTREEVNQILKAASESDRLKGILDYTDEPLVSIDLMHTPASSTCTRYGPGRAPMCGSAICGKVDVSGGQPRSPFCRVRLDRASPSRILRPRYLLEGLLHPGVIRFRVAAVLER
jgi:hypothetical protein